MSQTSSRTTSPPRNTKTPAAFQGLEMDNKGGITYHGATSLFNLPHSNLPTPIAAAIADPIAEIERRKERLVESAWQQRELESFSEIPVSPLPCLLFTLVIIWMSGTIPIHTSNTLVLDSANVQLCISSSFHTYE